LQNRLGLIRFQRQDFEGARSCFEKALLVNPGYRVAKSNLAFSFLELGKMAQAESLLKEALRSVRSASARNEMAVLRMREERPAEAEDLLREAVSLESRNALYPHNLAMALFLQNKIDDAVSSLKEAERLCPPYSEFFAESLLFTGNRLSVSSYQSYMRQHEMNPYLSELHDHLGHAFAANGFLREAEAEYRFSLRTMPSLSNYYGNMALLCSAENKDEEALHFHLKAVDAEPDSVKAHVALAFEYSARGCAVEAMKEFETAKTLRPGYPDIRYNLGLVYLELDRRDDAIREFRAALKSNQDYLFARNSLALALYKAGELEESLEEYERVCASGLSSSDILVSIGVIHREKGALDRAVDYFNRAICLNADYAPAYYQLGQTYHAMGMRTRAREAWKAYLDRAHEEAEVADVRKAMEEE